MAVLPISRGDREYEKFVLDGTGNTAIRTTATISGDINVESLSSDAGNIIGKPVGGDFVTAYASGTTITCSSLPAYYPTLRNEDIYAIQQISSAGAVVETYMRKDATMSVALNVITVTGATFAASDSFIVFTNIFRQNDNEIGAVEIKDGTANTRATVDSTNALKVFDAVTNALVPVVYDYISLTYTGSNMTGVVYKTGGAGGATVSTLTLAYTGSRLDTITKT